MQFKSPFQVLFYKLPNYSSLRTFGYATFLFLRPYHRNKFSFHTEKCVFVGYSLQHKGYKCMSSTNKIYIVQSVRFNEFKFPFLYDLVFQKLSRVSVSCTVPRSFELKYLPTFSLLTKFIYPKASFVLVISYVSYSSLDLFISFLCKVSSNPSINVYLPLNSPE